jgi:exopolysaccharide biosynthesis protein
MNHKRKTKPYPPMFGFLVRIMKRTNQKLTPVWAVVLIDLLVLLVLLSTFCYFHHIREIWGADLQGLLGDEDAPTTTQAPVMVVTRPPRPTVTTTTAPKPPVTPGLPETKPLPETGPAGTADSAVTTTEKVPEVTEPVLDTSGDFGYLHADKFAPAGVVNTADGYYQSHDIAMTVTEVDTVIEQYRTKSSTTKSKTRVRYFLADIYVRNIDNLFTSYSAGKNQSFNNLLKDTGSIFALSGDVFNSGASSKEVIIRNGNVIRYKDHISSDICVLYWDGTMETITPAEYNWEKILAKAPYQAWSFGPGLLNDDGSVISKIQSNVWRTNPRAAIGYVEPGHYVLLAVHGNRDENSANCGEGLNLSEVARVLSEAGCKQAYNLDGGASVYSYYDGEMLVEFSGQRKISDIICIGEIG